MWTPSENRFSLMADAHPEPCHDGKVKRIMATLAAEWLI
jgi:hypothetical protein